MGFSSQHPAKLWLTAVLFMLCILLAVNYGELKTAADIDWMDIFRRRQQSGCRACLVIISAVQQTGRSGYQWSLCWVFIAGTVLPTELTGRVFPIP